MKVTFTQTLLIAVRVERCDLTTCTHSWQPGLVYFCFNPIQNGHWRCANAARHRSCQHCAMGSVNNHALVDKLHNLNSTQQSIETVSAWCSFYRKDARKVVAIWEQEFVKMPMAKQLAMSYLANDILQNSRKKGPEFVHEFYKTLPRAVKHLLKHGDDKVRRAVNRLVDIWEDRKVSAQTKCDHSHERLLSHRPYLGIE